MKNFQNLLPTFLLLAYAVYSAFIPVTIAHSIIFLSLAGLAGYQLHISRQVINKFNEETLAGLKNELEIKLSQHKEFYDRKLSKLEDELAKTQLNQLPSKAGSSSSIPSPRKVVF